MRAPALSPSVWVEALDRGDPLTLEWARAQRFWTPLSLIAVDASRLEDSLARDRVGAWLLRACRDVDVACRTGEARYCVILPSTNRTGAEAELARLLSEADRAFDSRAGRIGFGLAVAFDEANTALELKVLAERDAEIDTRRPDPHETPTIPQLGSETWIEPMGRDEPLTQPHFPG